MITHLNQAAVILALSVHVRVTSDLGVCEKRFRKIFCTSLAIVHARQGETRTARSVNHELFHKFKKVSLCILVRDFRGDVVVNGLWSS